jgi:hypothetical protein
MGFQEGKMRKTPLLLAKTDGAIGISQLKRESKGWLLDGEIRQLSEATLQNRYFLLRKLLWFLRRGEYAECGSAVRPLGDWLAPIQFT